MALIYRRQFFLLLFIIVATGPAAAQLPSWVPTSGLLAYYGFNGNANDLSGNSVNGILTGPTYVTDRYGNSSAALHYSGSGERVLTHKINRTTINNFSYSLWVNTLYTATIPLQGGAGGLASDAPYSCVIAPVDGVNWGGGSTHVGAGLNVASNGVYVVEHGSGITNTSLAWSGSLLGWHHIAVVYTAGTPKLYVDGAYVQTGVTSTHVVHPSMGCDSFALGSSYPYVTAGYGHGLFPITVPSYNFSGYLDDIAIYGRSLTPCEVELLYDTVTVAAPVITGTMSLSPCNTTALSVSVSGGTWTSSNTSVATVGSTTGIVTGVGPGTTTITYAIGGGCPGICEVTVNPFPAISGAAGMCVGSSATYTDSLTGGVWSSSSSLITVGSSSGVVTGISDGTAILTYTLPSGCIIITTIAVNPMPSITSAVSGLCLGLPYTFTASISGGDWASSNTTVATVGSSSGVVTGGTTGTATITYTMHTGCSVSYPVTVSVGYSPITGITTICNGNSTTLADASPGGSWSSSNPGVATIGTASGIVTSVGPGTSVISYGTIGTCSAIATLVVNPLPGAISGSGSVCTAQTITLTDAGSGTWTTSDASVATVGSTTGIVTGVAAGTANITYTLPTGCYTTKTITVNTLPAPIAGSSTVCTGTTITLTDTYTGGTWTSSSTTVATIGSGSGIVNGMGSGVTTISYTTSSGCRVTKAITVNVTPGAISGPSLVCTGQTTSMVGAGSGVWTSSDATLATVDLITGVVTGVAAGSVTITFTVPSGCYVTKALTVNVSPAPITGAAAFCLGASITLSDVTTGGTWSSGATTVALVGSTSGMVTGVGTGTAVVYYTAPNGCMANAYVTVNPLPGAISGASSVCMGNTTTLTDGGGGIWSSSDILVATIGSASGMVTGVHTGTAIITYTLPTGCKTTTPIVVNPVPALITGGGMVCMGATSMLYDASTGGIWVSASPSYASIGSSSGLVTGVGIGTTVISYVLPGGCLTTTIVTVNPTPGAISGGSSVCAGQTLGLYCAGSGTWSSGSPTIATVGSSTGVVYGVTAGVALITYTLPTGCFSYASVTVNPVPSTITGTPHVCMGGSTPLSSGSPGGSWTSSDYGVAYIDPSSGLVTGMGAGVATISYATGLGCASLFTMTVMPLPDSIGGVTSVCIGLTSALSDPGGGTWSIAPTTVATVDPATGLLTGVGTGSAVVTYTLPSGCAISTSVMVNPGPTAIAGTPMICIGLTSLLTDASPGGSWSSSNTSVATVLPTSGLVTGVSSGVSIISYSMGTGCAATMVVTVNTISAPITGVPYVCAGGTTTYSDASPGGLWSISPTTIATMTPTTGIVTGIAPGVATISYSLGVGCTATYTITVNPAPPPIAGTASVCPGLTTVLSATGGGTWTSATTTIATIGSISGIVTGIASGTTPITYTLGTGCMRTQVVTVNIAPSLFLVTGGGSYCTGTGGTHIGLSGSSAGVNYQLFNGTTPMGASVPGTGTVLDLGAVTATGTYTVLATGAGGGCSRNMTGTATVSVNPLPALYLVTGGGSYCAGGVGVHVYLSGSTAGINYQIYNGTTPGGILAGTGAALDFGLLTAGGSYTVVATDPVTSCSRNMTASATITVSPLPLPISGPTALCVGATASLSDLTPGGIFDGGLLPVLSVTPSGIITGVGTGVAVIDYITPAGCIATLTVTVSAGPVAIGGPSTVCVGETAALTDAVPGGIWTSSTTAATIGSLSGLVTGLSAGTTTITYSLGSGCTVTKAVTVNPGPLAISGSATICTGTSAPLTDASPGGVWSSSAMAVGTVSTSGVVYGVSTGTTVISYSLSGCSATRAVTVNPAPAPIGGPATVCVGSSITATDGVAGGAWSTPSSTLSVSPTGVVTGVTGGIGPIIYAIGSCTVSRSISINPVPVVSGVAGLCTGTSGAMLATLPGGAWTSSGTGVATVGSSSGLVTAVAPGVATITYTLPTGCTAAKSVTVNSAPSPIGGSTQLCMGGTTLLTNGSGGGVWTISPLSVASIGSASGMVTAVSTGTATASYSLGSGCVTSITVTVNPLPAAITGAAQVCVGSSILLSDISVGGAWSSSTLATGTINAATGNFFGLGAGTTTVSYTLPTGCLSSRVISVNPLPAAIAGAGSVCAGFTQPMTDVTTGGVWSVSPVALASVGSASGMVLGVLPGSVTLTYTLPSGCSIARALTVNSSPAAIGGSSAICIGASTSLTDVSPGGVWSTSMAAVATVGSTGVVHGVTVGTATITYLAAGCPALKTITVNALPEAIGGADHVCPAAAVTLTDASPGGYWSSSNPSIATVGSASGLVSGMASGSAAITYSLGVGCTVTRIITVNPMPTAIIGASNVCAGGNTTLSDPAPGGIWSSTMPAVATVGTTGVVHGVTGGSSLISYTLPTGCAAVVAVSVIAVPAISGVHNLCAWGDTMTLHDGITTGIYTSSLVTATNLGGGAGRINANAPGIASVTYILPSGCTTTATFTVNALPGVIYGSGHVCSGASLPLSDITPGGVWSSGAPAVATVGSTGIVTGIASGTAWITYTMPATGCRTDTMVYVHTMPGAIAGPASVFIGSLITLTDPATGGTWSSSNVLRAIVGSGSGLVTGVATGVATITYTTGSVCTVTKTITVMPSLTGHKEGHAWVGTDLVAAHEVIAMPNPGPGIFNVRLNWDTEETVSIVITNVAGEKVADYTVQTLAGAPVTVPMKLDVPAGMYLMTVKGGSFSTTQRLAVQY